MRIRGRRGKPINTNEPPQPDSIKLRPDPFDTCVDDIMKRFAYRNITTHEAAEFLERCQRDAVFAYQHGYYQHG